MLTEAQAARFNAARNECLSKKDEDDARVEVWRQKSGHYDCRVPNGKHAAMLMRKTSSKFHHSFTTSLLQLSVSFYTMHFISWKKSTNMSLVNRIRGPKFIGHQSRSSPYRKTSSNCPILPNITTPRDKMNKSRHSTWKIRRSQSHMMPSPDHINWEDVAVAGSYEGLY
ncbi:uncharacterized protein CC84DRAFT_765133 [Paraphaeosphaeria sporulosa]|uniref:Uncharacterized protein n=1 Tax=Paraphaeosphaeria sporulosa TaxID=1460663 RepID=A0A177CGU7_9PLEO|nr:uncharacterized protein CC84DRAFT_765133 [Paraphaeosphaeria sporulosa]OAG06451.1 hypothetical protein CC84DRAFT_765133 [Paraphaeosphaeria sporulosa]